MIDIIYRYDPNREEELHRPMSVDEAQRRLEAGNRQFASVMLSDNGEPIASPPVIHFRLQDMGLAVDGKQPIQTPYAVVLGCSDARVPVEMIYSEGCNNLFVIRVAGNILGNECLGSIDYALGNFPESLKLVVVMGHTGCGAVTAAVNAFLDPSQYLEIASNHRLRAIVDRLLLAVHVVDGSLMRVHGPQVSRMPGYRQALIESAVVFNAGLTAATLQHELVEKPAPNVRVCFTVYDITSRIVRVPLQNLEHQGLAAARLQPAPEASGGLTPFADRIVSSEFIEQLLMSNQ